MNNTKNTYLRNDSNSWPSYPQITWPIIRDIPYNLILNQQTTLYKILMHFISLNYTAQ